jgi:hypothetical protein
MVSVHRMAYAVALLVSVVPIGSGSSSLNRRVGPCPTNLFGFGASSIAKGYKLFAIADLNQGFINWMVKPMNNSESKVAKELIVGIEKEGYLVGDGEYDRNQLYEIAGHRNIQLIAPQRIRGAKGLGHRRHSFYRLRAIELQKRKFGESLISARSIIERMFGRGFLLHARLFSRRRPSQSPKRKRRVILISRQSSFCHFELTKGE